MHPLEPSVDCPLLGAVEGPLLSSAQSGNRASLGGGQGIPLFQESGVKFTASTAAISTIWSFITLEKT